MGIVGACLALPGRFASDCLAVTITLAACSLLCYCVGYVPFCFSVCLIKTRLPSFHSIRSEQVIYLLPQVSSLSQFMVYSTTASRPYRLEKNYHLRWEMVYLDLTLLCSSLPFMQSFCQWHLRCMRTCLVALIAYVIVSCGCSCCICAGTNPANFIMLWVSHLQQLHSLRSYLVCSAC